MLDTYIGNLFELIMFSEANPDNEELADWIFTYNIAFPLAHLITIGYVDVSTLPKKSIDEITETWIATQRAGYLN